MNAKELLVKTAASLQLDACGAASVNFSEKLSERLTEAGTIPFAPDDIKERIDTEALLPGSRSFFCHPFPLPAIPQGGRKYCAVCKRP